MYLDTLQPQRADVGYGQLGMFGNLGYEDKKVQIGQRHYAHALSSHGPARLAFQLDGRFASFFCQVALNDDASPGLSYAEFSVLADGNLVASTHVMAGDAPRALNANITGAQFLELMVSTAYWEFCHALWLDPQLSESAIEQSPETLVDCLGRAEITVPAHIPCVERCIATVVSPGFENLLDDMLGSLYANGGCQDALLVVFAIRSNEACEQVVAKYGGTLIHCRPHTHVNTASKSILYSVARFVRAQQFLCLDADMLVLGDLKPIFVALDACAPGSILACREGNNRGAHHLERTLCNIYFGQATDLKRILGTAEPEVASYPLIVNDGLFAGNRSSLLALDSVIRSMPGAIAWTDERHDIWWRNQFIFNLALARLQCGVELDSSYNIQLHVHDVEMNKVNGRLQAIWHGRSVRVLHFNGVGRHKHSQYRNLFAHVPDPLVGKGDGDGYAAFLQALRSWVGLNGLRALAWSFYGTTDGSSARARDPAVLPLLALLHYLVRANGCARVLETGTARGVSAACLASAVAHRPGARVVSLDPYPQEEREDLWTLLPETMRTCIEARTVGSVEGMDAALNAGECYDAVLLDSIHSEEYVWQEFQHASQIVHAGGLIMIHDVQYVYGTVEQALRRIEEAGYGVVRLWTAESGTNEDDHLGLAVIENRHRAG